jgi:hypothetical protein
VTFEFLTVPPNAIYQQILHLIYTLDTNKCLSARFLSKKSHQDQITKNKCYCAYRHLLPSSFKVHRPHISIHLSKRRGLRSENGFKGVFPPLLNSIDQRSTATPSPSFDFLLPIWPRNIFLFSTLALSLILFLSKTELPTAQSKQILKYNFGIERMSAPWKIYEDSGPTDGSNKL